MRHKLKEIPPEGLVVAEAVTDALVDEALVDTDVQKDGARAARLDVRLFKNGEEVVATGKLAAQLTLSCSRCLGPAVAKLDVPVNAVFVPEGNDADDDDEVDPDEPDRLTHDRIAVDLASLVRDLLIVNLPMTALCKDDCQGLCVVCGGNRNDADCGHAQQGVDLSTQRLPLGDIKLDKQNQS